MSTPDMLAALDLPASHIAVLRQIMRHPQSTLTELRARLVTEDATLALDVSAIIQELEAGGWLVVDATGTQPTYHMVRLRSGSAGRGPSSNTLLRALDMPRDERLVWLYVLRQPDCSVDEVRQAFAQAPTMDIPALLRQLVEQGKLATIPASDTPERVRYEVASRSQHAGRQPPAERDTARARRARPRQRAGQRARWPGRRMLLKLRRWLERRLAIRPADFTTMLVLFCIQALGNIALEIADVAATGGFLYSLGLAYVPALWALDMGVILLAGIVFWQLADRYPRRTVMRSLVTLCSGAFLLSWLLLQFTSWQEIGYTLLYLITDIQINLFPITVGLLAQDRFVQSQMERLSARIAAGATVGKIAGGALAGWLAATLAAYNISLALLVLVSLFALLLTIGMTWLLNIVPQRVATEQLSLRSAWRESRAFLQHVEVFRSFVSLVSINELLKTFVEFWFLLTLTQSFLDPLAFAAFFASYKVVQYITTLVLQVSVAPRLMHRLGGRNYFFVLPSVLGLIFLSALASTAFWVAVGSFFAMRVVFESLEEPARKTLISQVPEEKRGTVSTFIENIVYSLSTLAAVLLLFVLIWLANMGVDATLLIRLVAGLSLVGVGAGLLLAVRIRASYDKSQWNWRLGKRKRGSSKEMQDILKRLGD